MTEDEETEIKVMINKMTDYWFAKVLERMARGKSFEDALEAVREEILNG